MVSLPNSTVFTTEDEVAFIRGIGRRHERRGDPVRVLEAYRDGLLTRKRWGSVSGPTVLAVIEGLINGYKAKGFDKISREASDLLSQAASRAGVSAVSPKVPVFLARRVRRGDSGAGEGGVDKGVGK